MERFVAAWKQIDGKTPDLRNAKQHYQSFLRKNNKKVSKTIIINYHYLSTKKINIYQPKSFKKFQIRDNSLTVFIKSSKSEIIINESDIDDVFQSVYTTFITNIQKSLGKGSGWNIDSVIDHTISVSEYNLLAGSSYI